jgi:hypothetical protein
VIGVATTPDVELMLMVVVADSPLRIFNASGRAFKVITGGVGVDGGGGGVDGGGGGPLVVTPPQLGL